MDLDFVRKQFPALEQDFIYMDNAGGSQCLETVAERISGYLLHHNVQLGASYKVSREAGEKLNFAKKKLAQYINCERPEEAIIGPSSSMLLRILSLCISRQWEPGDRIIVTNTDHEANVSPWTDLEEKGFEVKIWKTNPESLQLELEDLKKLMNERTKLVAFTHCSNILGTINPVKEITDFVHANNALVCVDGVAYAPHRQIDVKEWDVDFYVFSWYKTFGPHLAVMYGKYELLYEMPGINHYFFKKEDVPYKFQPGNFNFELTYGLLGIIEYYEEFFKKHFPKKRNLKLQEKLEKCFHLIAKHEEKISAPLISFLQSKPEVRIIGLDTADASKRVPTISFVHSAIKSDEIVEQVDEHRIGIRFGDFYAKKLIADAGLTANNGVVRVSLVHYNSAEEVKKLMRILNRIL
ncbi:cysteine desulfurase-like protein [Salegentibacter sp. HM20]